MCVNFKLTGTPGRVVKNNKSAGFQRPMVCSQQQLRVKKRLRFYCLKKNKYLRNMDKYAVFVVPIPNHYTPSVTLIYC